ncbi:MAG: L-seryl-tRNA(Sec) selenium transferase [Actinomycetota bacterium]
MTTSDEVRDRLRELPSVEVVVAQLDDLPHGMAVAAARNAIDSARRQVRSGGSVSVDDIVSEARAVWGNRAGERMSRVINATGVLLHTNLGRAPLGHDQLDAMRSAAGYSDLELDRLSGKRGSRHERIERLLQVLTGCEAAIVVNNNAAALLLCLRALCAERDVIVSRGELIEIGGEFRIPEVLAESEARMVEVGTTNRTHTSDYEKAIGPQTAAILKVHTSNYKVVGFAAAVPTPDLSALAHGRNLFFIHDLGSGLVERPPGWDADESTIREAVAAGPDVVTFSGDKLIGGPQAGIAVGKSDAIEAMRRHPLMRALRVDKVTLSGLDATLESYANGSWTELPLWTMALMDDVHIKERVDTLAETVGKRLGDGVTVSTVETGGAVGGGAMPEMSLPSWALQISSTSPTPDEIRRRLLGVDPPVVARIENDAVLFDLRSVDPEDDPVLTELVIEAFA